MGLTKATHKPPTPGGTTPWFLPSGNYPATGAKVEITPSANQGYTYKVHFLPEYDLAPSPIDLPRVSVSLESTSPEDMKDLYAILGVPYQEGNRVKWDDTGLLRWNGDTGDGARFSGKVELTIQSKPPKYRPAREGFAEGWFQASYEIKLVSPPGESERIGLEAQMALVEQRQPPLPGTVAPPPPPARPNKK